MTDMPARTLWAGRILALLGILLVALNLRSAVASLSPIITEVSADIPLSALAVGILGSLPPVCFAVFGILTPVFTRRIGLEGMLLIALAAMLVGHLLRGMAGSLALLLLGSVVVFAGLGIGNVLLPPLVKKYFPDRIGLMTSLYATALSLSALTPPLVAVPVADAAGWRVSLGIWSVVALAALVPWVTMLARHRIASGGAPPLEVVARPLKGQVGRSPVAWAIAAIFATSSLNAYAMFAWLPQLLRDTAGVTPAEAGILLSLYAAMGLPAGLIIPVLAARMRNVAVLVYVGAALFLAGTIGLLLFPSVMPWLWVSLAGLGPLYFPLALVLINLRTRTHEGAVALSGFVQGIGYTVGALGPLLVGVLHEATGGWEWPLIFLTATIVASIFAAFVIGRPHMLEDDLAAQPARAARR
jgi:MFS transporter, CP family, cyanate transporter